MSIFRTPWGKTRARIALVGPARSGKTYTALRMGTRLGRRVAVIDSKRTSALKYSNQFDFDVVELQTFEPQRYVEAIRAAEAAGYDVIVIDSLWYACAGRRDTREQVDREAQSSRFSAWREEVPIQNDLVETILQSRCHVLVTMRVTMHAKNERGLGQVDRKSVHALGPLGPLQRELLEHKFDLVGELDPGHNLHISKSRCSALANRVIPRPGEALADTVMTWLLDGPQTTFTWPERFRAAPSFEALTEVARDYARTGHELSRTERSTAVHAYRETEARLKAMTDAMNGKANGVGGRTRDCADVPR